jgi:hypothetical protein
MTNMRGAAPADTRLNDLVEQRFPLLPRSKPVCRSLTDRIDRVRRQADLASQHTDDALLRAAEAHNLVACGVPIDKKLSMLRGSRWW